MWCRLITFLLTVLMILYYCRFCQHHPSTFTWCLLLDISQLSVYSREPIFHHLFIALTNLVAVCLGWPLHASFSSDVLASFIVMLYKWIHLHLFIILVFFWSVTRMLVLHEYFTIPLQLFSWISNYTIDLIVPVIINFCCQVRQMLLNGLYIW